MSAQLLQLLAQLDRPGATEIVVATGRPVAVRIQGAYQPLTASAVTLPQLLHLVRETPLAAMVPASEQVGDPVEIDLDGRPLRAQFIRQGPDVLLRLEHRPQPQPPARPTPLPARSAPQALTRPAAPTAPPGARIAPSPAAEPAEPI
ncbi:MAG TPA: hypothetical protein VF469_26120, partial [Kofleriaceae bacterium]